MSRIPNGEKPAGRSGSVNEALTGAKFLLKTSILFCARLTAYRRFPDVRFVIASPVYLAPDLELSTATIASLKVAWLEGAHAMIVPSIAANKKTEGDLFTRKSGDAAPAVGLNTIPVGDPGPFSPAVGISTFSA